MQSAPEMHIATSMRRRHLRLPALEVHHPAARSLCRREMGIGHRARYCGCEPKQQHQHENSGLTKRSHLSKHNTPRRTNGQGECNWQ
jgi:hypothetical protein